MSPCNVIPRKESKFVFLYRNEHILTELMDCCNFLRKYKLLLIKCTELVSGCTDLVGVKDALEQGLVGVIIGYNEACTPTVFQMEWPPGINNGINSLPNLNGNIINSDLKLAGLVLLYLIMEEVCELLSGKHVKFFINNKPTVHWVQILAPNISVVTGHLILSLALWLIIKVVSPLTKMHIAGVDNATTETPPRSFGSEAKFYCKNYTKLLHLFNSKFPIPEQTSWTVFRPYNAISMRMLYVLRMKDYSM